MNKKILSTIFISLFLIITVLIIEANTVYAANITVGDITYNENDITKLRTFLNHESVLAGTTNGKALNSKYDENKPATWTGVTWTNDAVKRIKTISWDTKSLAGTLDLSGATSMTSLVCSNNKLTTLNVSGNTAMTILSCFSNQLTELDLRTNKKLIAVNCSFNKLSDIDVSLNTALTNLCCYSNDIIKLDVSKNTALTYLDCNTNKLTELTVSTNKRLNKLFCYANQINKLDLSNNTLLTSLDCHSNKLSKLNVDANIELTLLNCNFNQLAELDLSKNIKIAVFNCSDNKLAKINLILPNNSINLISHGNGYVELFLDGSKAFTTAVPFQKASFTSWVDMFTYAQVSTSNTYNLNFTTGLTYNLQADFAQNVIFNSQGGSEVTAIKVNYDSKVTAPAIPLKDGCIFGGWYKEADCINKWDFSADKVTAETTLYAKWTPREVVIFGNVAYDVNDYTMLKTFLNQSKFDYIDEYIHINEYEDEYIYIDEYGYENTIYRVKYEDECINGKRINKAYDENNPTTWIGVTWTDGSVKRLKTISWFNKGLYGKLDLSRASELTSLDCSHNNIIALNIKDDLILTNIDCEYNHLGEINVSGNTELKYLDCSFNQLTRLDINSNKKLTGLDCFGNKLVSLNVSVNVELTNLNCSGNNLTDLDISKNTKIFYLKCTSNHLTNLDISKNAKLYYLYCSYNKLTELDMSKNQLLKEVECSGNKFTRFNAELANDIAFKSVSLIANGNGYFDISIYYPMDFRIRVQAMPRDESKFTNWTDSVNNTVISTASCYDDFKPGMTYYLQANFSQNVIFNPQGGSEIAAKIVNYNSAIEEPEIPIYEGYVFDGWYKEAACINAWNFAIDVVTAETILYAKWVSKDVIYTVTFNVNGGNAVSNISNIIYGDTIAAPTTPTRDGYDFKGWYKDLKYKNAWDFTKDVVKSDLILYAKWIASGKTYTVKFNVDGNTVSEISNIKYGDIITAPAEPIKNGFKFKGWYKDSALLDAWDFTTDVVKANMTLYTKWTAEEVFYTVTFVDGKSTYPKINNVAFGDTINEPIAPDIKNYVFIGWYKECEYKNVWDFTRDVVTANTILYARWVASTNVNVGDTTYNGNDYIKLRAFLNQESAMVGITNGQMLNTVYDENSPDTWTGVSWCSYDDDVKYIKEISWASKSIAGKLDLSGAKYLEKLNCSSNQLTQLDVFGTWSLYSLDCSYNHINKLISSCPNIDCSSNGMTALSLNSEVAYLKCDGNKFSEIDMGYLLTLISSDNGYLEMDYIDSEHVSIVAVPNMGSLFVNWTDIETGDQVSSSSTIYRTSYHEMQYEILFYKANFSQNVIFNSQGGSEVDAIPVNYNSIIKAPNRPIYEGYTFKGWYKEADCINAWNFDKDVVKTNITLYAKWDADDFIEEATLNENIEDVDLPLISVSTYKVEFNIDMDNVFLVLSNVTSGNAIEITNIPVNEGYTFKGWYRDKNCTEPWDFATDVVIADIKLYAKWLPI